MDPIYNIIMNVKVPIYNHNKYTDRRTKYVYKMYYKRQIILPTHDEYCTSL